MRITIVRKIVQVVMFGLFMAFCLLTSFAYLDRLPGLRFWLGKFLEIDPLVSLATAVTTHSLYRGLLWSLLLLVPTLLLGRFFCDWICPYGILHHFVGWAFGLPNDKRKIESNQYRRLYGLKYYILIGMLAAALFGSLQVGLLDPICLIHRSFTVAVEPAWDMAIVSVERPLETDFSAWRFRRDPGV
ncbi:MAG: 4Fe-4S binding protein, partial [Phycisphaerae bacterium]